MQSEASDADLCNFLARFEQDNVKKEGRNINNSTISTHFDNITEETQSDTEIVNFLEENDNKILLKMYSVNRLTISAEASVCNSEMSSLKGQNVTKERKKT